MAAQPTEDAVAQMVEMTGLPKAEAMSRLKGNNNDVGQAVNEYFENPNGTSYRWDEDPFNSARDGSYNNSGIAFQIQGPDDRGSGGYLSGAPSRPPSRTSNKSPAGRTLHSTNDTIIKMDGDQDVDLQRALVESAQEAGLPPQEYGITNTNAGHFGPVNCETDEQRNWTMVHIPKDSSQGIAAEPEAENRKRDDGTPAFLRSAIDGSRLASILTLYHEIPLAREIFLRREDLLSDFGHNSQWWSGKAIYPSRKSRRFSGSESTMEPEERELVHELQRLMAFLDKTERSYGSIESLANLNIIKRQTDDVEGGFFEAWKSTQLDSSAVKSIFSAAVQPKGDGTQNLETSAKEFAILDLFLPNADDDGELETIYDLTDKVLWMCSGLDTSNSAYMTNIADVIGFRLAGAESSRNVRIPETWYPDRYMEQGRDAAIEMRKQKQEIRDVMAKLFEMETLLTYHDGWSNKPAKVQEMFQASLMHDAEPTAEDAVNGVAIHSDDTAMQSGLGVEAKTDLSANLEIIMANIDRKLIALNKEKQKTLASLRELSKLYTTANTDPNQPPFNKYKLCGVSIANDITYLRRQAEPDLIDMDLDGTENNMNKDQWWRIQYTAERSKPVLVEKVDLDDVLKAAMTESKSSIVVYANEKAMTEPVQPLPDSLAAFVRADNLAFSAEFPQNPEYQDFQSPLPSPVSPGKRKYDERSEDSMDAAPRYTEHTRWGGQSPVRDNGVVIHHRELDSSDDNVPNGQDWTKTANESGGESETPRGSEIQDVIMGQDPHEMANLSFPSLVNSGPDLVTQEMQEKSGVLALLPSAIEDVLRKPNRVDGMDLDDDNPTAEDGTIKEQSISSSTDMVSK